MTDYNFFGDVPEEMKRAMAQQADKGRMAEEVIRHDIQRLLDETPKDHLLTIRSILRNIAFTEDFKLAAWLDGQVTAILHGRFNVCSGCGQDQPEAFQRGLEKAAEERRKKRRVGKEG